MSLRQAPLLSAVLLCLILSSVAANATNPQFSAIYVFGDSYCDAGNLFLADGGTYPPTPPYYMGHFSNGPVWAERVADSWTLPLKPSLAGGTDYAFGGAFVTADQPLGGGAVIPSVPHQVELYLLQHGGKADPNALYVLEGGGNDIIDATGGSPQQLAFQIAAGTAASELLLRRAGARNFLIPELFDLATVPEGHTNAAFNTAASLATNKFLEQFLQLENLFPGVRITLLHSFDLFKAVETESTHFGFTNVTDACIVPTSATTFSICSDPAHYMFWDDIHPTIFMHSFIAVQVLALYSH
jgi:phospholipase/lecithinase/hemolysin